MIESTARLQSALDGGVRSASKVVRRSLWRKFLLQKRGIPSLVLLGAWVFGALFAPVLAPYSPNAVNMLEILRAPSSQHWLGTDDIGRDVLTRLLFGAQISLSVAGLAVGLALLIALPVGILAGYRGGSLDLVVMRIADSLLALPSLVLAMALAATIGNGFQSVIVAIALVAVPSYVRLVRGQTLQAKQLGYVEAGRCVGSPDIYIMTRHILPNIISPLIVQSSLNAAQAILTEAGLSFLGVGIKLPAPTWGGMIRSASNYMEVAPWLVFSCGAAIFVCVLAFNLLGDALRDTLDPRLG